MSELFTLQQLANEISKEDMWYINYHGKCEKPSEIGYKTAIILARLFQGMHHVPVSQIKKMEWTNDRFLSFTHFGSMATFDDNLLTQLVLLAHKYCARVEIRPCNFNYFTIHFHNRTKREGRFYERHPTEKQAGLEEVQ